MKNADYSDIIDMEAPVSKKHRRMFMEDRAAQFAPFAALSGHSELLKNTEKEVFQRENLKGQDFFEADFHGHTDTGV